MTLRKRLATVARRLADRLDPPDGPLHMRVPAAGGIVRLEMNGVPLADVTIDANAIKTRRG